MEAFEEVVKDHSPKIYYFLRRMGLAHEAADEIVQDVFILFWRDLKNGHGLEGVHFRLYQHAAKNCLVRSIKLPIFRYKLARLKISWCLS